MFKNLKDIFNKEQGATLMQQITIVLDLCIIAHSSLVVFFIFTGIIPLMLFNIGSIIFYVYLLKSLYADRLLLTFYCACAEIVLHTLMCIVFVGGDYSFQLYIPAIVPIMFFLFSSLKPDAGLRTPVIVSSVLLLLFMGANVYNHYIPPVYTDIKEGAKLVIQLYNSLIIFFMLIFFSFLFILQIREKIRQIDAQRNEMFVLASTDPLTGLLNRRRFMELSNKIIKDNKSFCILLADIDDFKKVNDTYGHDCGDEVLVLVTGKFKELFGEPNYVCRWGGEEIIVLYQESFENGVAAGERIRAAIAESKLTYGRHELHMSVTIGVSFFDGRFSLDNVITWADGALYRGKQNGKNQVQSG